MVNHSAEPSLESEAPRALTASSGVSRHAPLRHRRARRGAALFVVMLVIVGLSAAGLFAVRASLSALDNAGRHRQMVLTQQVAELGTNLAISELSRNAQRYKAELVGGAATTPARPCRSASPARPECTRISMQQLQVAFPAVPLVEAQSGSAPGGLGFGAVRANFGAEITDVVVGPPAPGYATSSITSSMSFYRFTVSTTGQILPNGVAMSAAPDAKFAGSTVDTRAHVLVGPLH